MKKTFINLFLFASVFLLLFCSGKKNKDKIGALFQKEGVKGSFLLYDYNAKKYIVKYNFKRCKEGFLPASTFKILNSLIILETKAVENENKVLKWDGEKRQFGSWNKDHTLKSAIKYSVVWVYQKLAKKVGNEKMLHFLNKTNYGNKDISAGIDLFWLEGNFRISQVDQIKFLVNLYENKLPFSLETMKTVKEMIINKKTENYTLYGKTGLVMSQSPMIGWWIGWVTYKGNAYFFANNIELYKDKSAPWGLRQTITDKILRMSGINIQ